MRGTLAINQPSMLPAAAESTKAAEIQATSTVKAEEKKVMTKFLVLAWEYYASICSCSLNWLMSIIRK